MNVPRAVFITTVLCLLCALQSRAQNATAEDLTSLSIEDLVRVKVFSASRHLEEARGAPAAVTVVTAEEIATYGWRTLGEVLNSVRSFYTAYDRNYTYLGVRGLLRPGDAASRRKIIPTASFETLFNDPGTWTRDTRAYLDFSYHHDFASSTELTLRTYYDRYHYRGDYAYDDGAGRYLNVDHAIGDWTGVDFNVGHYLGRHRVSLGAEYEYSVRANQDNFDVGGASYLHDRRTPWRTAAYSEAEIKLSSTLALSAGGRFDYFGQFGVTVSPRVAAIFQPNSRTTLKYIFGRAFRAPNAYQGYYTSSTQGANPDLAPETVLSHTVMVERTVTPWLLLSGVLFLNSIGNLVDASTDPDTGITRFVNVGQMKARGIELEARAGQPSGFHVHASYTATDARDPTTNTRLNNVSLHLAKLHGRAPLAGKAFAGLELLYSSALRSYQGTRISPTFLTNLTLSSRPLAKHWQLSASCYNLLGRRWQAPPALEHRQGGIEQDGRAFRVKLTYRFSTSSEPKGK